MKDILFFRKRSGRVVKFNQGKIASAIARALKETQAAIQVEVPLNTPEVLAQKVCEELNNPESQFYVQEDTIGSRIPKLEDVQDAVETVIGKVHTDIEGYTEQVATTINRLYSGYRKAREEIRNKVKVISKRKKEKVDSTDKGMLLQEADNNVMTGWDRNRLENDLNALLKDEDKSADIAKRVEKAVLKSGLQEVTSDLIAEFANNELTRDGLQVRLNQGNGYLVEKDFIDALVASKTKENSNVVNNNPEAINMAVAEYVLKKWGFDSVFSSDVVEAHQYGFIYIHDLGSIMKVYCSSHSVEYLKKYGLQKMLNLNTVSKPAKSASVLTGHINTFLASMQSNYAGALGLGYINVFYAPLLRGMNDEELHQVAQELIFNGSQNAFSRGGQTLFLDFNIHTGVPESFKDVPAILAGGKYTFKYNDGKEDFLKELETSDGLRQLWLARDNSELLVMKETKDGKLEYPENNLGKVLTYGDFEEEAQRFCKALLTVWGEGDANGHIFEFPKCDFHVSEATFNDPKQNELFNYACEITAKNGSVYFVFDRDSVTVASCCRLRVQLDASLFKRPESLRSSFPRNDMLVIRHNKGPVETTSFGRLYDEIDSPVVEEDGFHIKYLKNYEIWDKNGWTSLLRIMKHPKTASTHSDKLTVIRSDNGKLITVTDNHPFILSKSTRLDTCPKCGSSNISPRGISGCGKQIYLCDDCKKYSVGPKCVVLDDTYIVDARDVQRNDTITTCQNVEVEKTKHLDTREAYLLGTYVGDGAMYSDRKTVCICKPENHPTIIKAKKYAESLRGAPCTWSSGTLRFPTTICPDTLDVGHSAYIKQLPKDYLSWDIETFGAVVSGLIDTDGSMHKSEIIISSISKILVMQVQMYLDSIGIPSKLRLRDENPLFDNAVNGKEGFTPTHLAYDVEINCNLITQDLFKESIKVANTKRFSPLERKWDAYGRVTRITHCTDKQESWVYDVTTASHTFVSNGVLCHNCGFANCTINIPQCSYRTGIETGTGNPDVNSDTWNVFISHIDRAMDLAVKAHLQKKAHISRLMSAPGLPLWQVGMPSADGNPYIDLNKCVYIIGLIGLDDACRYLFGKSMHEDEKLTDWGLAVIAHMNLRCKHYSEEYGLTFTLEESPAESAARKLARTDLVHFPEQSSSIVHGYEGSEYYTNSIHIPADANVPLVERVIRQSMFHGMIDSGAITHAFIGEETPSPGAIADLVENIFKLTQSAQITFSPEFTYCQDCHGQVRGLVDKCPYCGSSNVEGETRVVGYFSRVSGWNKSKIAELQARHHGRYKVEEA